MFQGNHGSKMEIGGAQIQALAPISIFHSRVYVIAVGLLALLVLVVQDRDGGGGGWGRGHGCSEIVGLRAYPIESSRMNLQKKHAKEENDHYLLRREQNGVSKFTYRGLGWLMGEHDWELSILSLNPFYYNLASFEGYSKCGSDAGGWPR
ncbi:hypothetical protein MA16_Dca017075 [Dendrobium catenatum]|uniref:Uncharacterized protein n=1 Tax=Dendrobium catenatum TaxID=906689 RepID=A0A2I0VZF2_9ASPA|nr:hypothetical protein MA16_Dca017075 [Dendrobium catenatum]